MPKRSAGILLYKYQHDVLNVLLVHPGGPFWKNKDDGVWSIPKGEIDENEDPRNCAIREFFEETGLKVTCELYELGEVRQSSGKIVIAWACGSDFDPTTLKSNTFTTEWPPSSGRQTEFPEVDRAEWFDIPAASVKILKGQLPLLERLQTLIKNKAD